MKETLSINKDVVQTLIYESHSTIVLVFGGPDIASKWVIVSQ